MPRPSLRMGDFLAQNSSLSLMSSLYSTSTPVAAVKSCSVVVPSSPARACRCSTGQFDQLTSLSAADESVPVNDADGVPAGGGDAVCAVAGAGAARGERQSGTEPAGRSRASSDG